MMRQVSRPVRRGAGRKGRKDLARSLPGFKVLEVLFLVQVSQAFLPSKSHVGHTNFGTWGLANSIRSFSWCPPAPRFSPGLDYKKTHAIINTRLTGCVELF